MSLVVIPARYESSRFPGKPLALIDGVSMIKRVVLQCAKSKADLVVVATDDERIIKECEGIEGATAVMTSKEHNSGTDRVAEVALKFSGHNTIINVQGDEPFIPAELIDSLIDDLENDNVVMNTAAARFDTFDDVLDKNQVKVILDKDDFAIYFSRGVIPYVRDGETGLNASDYLKHLGIYGFKRDYLIKFADLGQGFLEKNEKLEQLRAIYNGDKLHVILTSYKPVSVDVPEDIFVAEKHLRKS